MFDKDGKKIDLDLIDAIGRLEDGCFDVWMSDGTRAITSESEAVDIWRNHIRSKVQRSKSRSTALA